MDRKRRQRYGRDEIAAILNNYDESGLSQIAFAGRDDLSVSTLRFWLTRRRREKPGAARSTDFVAVSVVERRSGNRLELDIGQDRRVLIPPDTDPEALSTLLPVILASC